MRLSLSFYPFIIFFFFLPTVLDFEKLIPCTPNTRLYVYVGMQQAKQNEPILILRLNCVFPSPRRRGFLYAYRVLAAHRLRFVPPIIRGPLHNCTINTTSRFGRVVFEFTRAKFRQRIYIYYTEIHKIECVRWQPLAGKPIPKTLWEVAAFHSDHEILSKLTSCTSSPSRKSNGKDIIKKN